MEKPLPQPQQAAQELRDSALECVQRWCTQYGELVPYRAIKLAYRYLKNTLMLRVR